MSKWRSLWRGICFVVRNPDGTQDVYLPGGFMPDEKDRTLIRVPRFVAIVAMRASGCWDLLS